PTRSHRPAPTVVSGPGGPLTTCAALFVVLSGLRATELAGSKHCSAAEEDEGEGEARADSSVLPVKAGGDDLRLAGRARLRRADEFDLVARRSVRGRADDLDQIATADRVIHR